jgi:hypothetical protein
MMAFAQPCGIDPAQCACAQTVAAIHAQLAY